MQATANNEFEQSYIRLRKQEARLYTDEQVSMLPLIDATHPHYIEWQIRGKSAIRLVNYLRKKNKRLQILEVGAGNGWLSNQLSKIPGSEVLGIDINQIELEQSSRVFSSKKNLKFDLCELQDLKNHRFDIIIFAASAQYFTPLESAIKTGLDLLSGDGEIHIVDTKFYTNRQVSAAQKRSASYFGEMNCGEMASYYHHHCYKLLDQFNYKILYKPGFLFHLLPGLNNPFPWIRIKADK